MKWKMRNPQRDRALWNYHQACQQAERAKLGSLIRRFPADGQMLASRINDVTEALLREIAREEDRRWDMRYEMHREVR